MPEPIYSKTLEKLKEAGITLPRLNKAVVLNPNTTNFKADFKADFKPDMVVVVTGYSDSALPKQVTESVTSDMKKGSKVEVSYSENTIYYSVKDYNSGNSKKDINRVWVVTWHRTVMGSALPFLMGENKTKSVSQGIIASLGVRFPEIILTKGDHPYITMNLSYTSKTNTEVKKSIVVAYNDGPIIQNGTVIGNLHCLESTDKNNDFIAAYEVKLADEKNVGKVSLVIDHIDGNKKDEIYSIGKEGVRLSQEDISGGLSVITLKMNDGYVPQKGFAAKSAKVKVSACDAYGWGPAQVMHVPISK